MSETPDQIPSSTVDIGDEAIAFMKSPDENPVPFDEIESMLKDVAMEGRLFEVMSRAINDESIKDSRKLMMIQIIGFSYTSSFSNEQYKGLTVLLGYYTRKVTLPQISLGENVVSMWNHRTISHNVRELASAITKDPNRQISAVDATRVFSSPPFSIGQPMLDSILNEVYPQR